jgi:hypothetical protein
MKKLILGLAVLLTASNLAVGIAYAAACEGTDGVRHCGGTCTTLPGGSCACGNGGCTTTEQQWVNAGGKGSVAELMETDY